MLIERLIPKHPSPTLLRVAGLMLFVLCVQQPRVAVADSKSEAKSHFRAGQKHYNLSEFSDALVEFREAYRLHSDPVFLYNIGQCERQLGHLEDAARFYRNYLREYPKAPNRQEVERRIDEIDETLKVQAAEARKRDEASVAPPPVASPPLPVAATPGEGRTDLTTTAPAPSASESPPLYTRWWFWTAVAAVAVGATVGIILATSGKEASPPSTGLGAQGVF